MQWLLVKPKIRGYYWYKRTLKDEDWTAYKVFVNPEDSIFDTTPDHGIWLPESLLDIINN